MQNTFVLGSQETLTMLTAAIEKAEELNCAISIAITDAGGDLLHFHRMDGAASLPVNIAISKARTAARSGKSTKALQDEMGQNPAMLSLPDTVMVQGGLPIIVKGTCIGAVGISGATSEIDEQVAQAVVDTLKPKQKG
jgi:glc operon protein GlcG